MNNVVALYKLPGETPLQALDRLKAARPDLKSNAVPLSYIGRLDPLAQGVLPVLVGDANKERDAYIGYDKRYYADILFGFESDTYDPLGIVHESGADTLVNKDDLEHKSAAWVGGWDQPYPPYSSKTVAGKPLFQWAREGIFPDLPTRHVEIYTLDLISTIHLFPHDIRAQVADKVNRVSGDFRQKSILEQWNKALDSFSHAHTFMLARFDMRVSSGTYVRSFAHYLGKEMGSSALAFHIVRTEAGPFSIKDTVL